MFWMWKVNTLRYGDLHNAGKKREQASGVWRLLQEACSQTGTGRKGGRVMLVATYKTKKSLKESVGQSLRYQETSMFGAEYRSTGKFAVVGPEAYVRKWYAEVTMENSIIVRVS